MIQHNYPDIQKHNILLFLGDAQGSLGRPVSTETAGLHFQTKAMDEMFDVKRQRRATLHRDVSLEFGRFGYTYQFETWKAAMGNRELIDDGDTEPGLDQRAHRGAEPRADGDIVVELLAGKDFGHDAPVGIRWVDADQRIADDFRRRNLLAACKWMPDRNDAEQLARRQRHEVE